MKRLRLLYLGVALLITTSASSDRVERAANRVLPELQEALKANGLKPGSAVFIRLYKHERVLELWVKQSAHFVLFRSYPICAYSGALGPKLREGDGQAPEGVYWVKAKQMNPASRFHLSFNLGYPNAFDQANGRTGSALMVHGNCVSVGCYAMTDEKIEEIYTLMDLAFKAGQTTVQVHAFPFRFTKANWQAVAKSENVPFWRDLEAIDQRFERAHELPNVHVRDKRYQLD